MKKTALLLTLCLLLGIKSYGQFSFGVAPGLSTNSAYFGYRTGKVVPYVGLQYGNIMFNTKETGQDYDYDLMDVTSYTDELNLKGNLLLPNIGVKFFAVEKNNLKAFFNLSVAKPFLSGKVEFNGEEEDEFGETLKEISLIAGELGFGVEYFLDNNFSIGGEFGIRYLGGKYSNSYEDSFYNPDTDSYQETEITNTFRVGSNPTFTKISLNFYFGGDE